MQKYINALQKVVSVLCGTEGEREKEAAAHREGRAESLTAPPVSQRVKCRRDAARFPNRGGLLQGSQTPRKTFCAPPPSKSKVGVHAARAFYSDIWVFFEPLWAVD